MDLRVCAYQVNKKTMAEVGIAYKHGLYNTDAIGSCFLPGERGGGYVSSLAYERTIRVAMHCNALGRMDSD